MIGGLSVVQVSTPPKKKNMLKGTATILPWPKQIMALLRSDMSYVASTMSEASTGEWAIRGLPEYPDNSLIVLELVAQEPMNIVVNTVSLIYDDGTIPAANDPHYITGTVKAKRRLVLWDKRSERVVSATFSETNNTYKLANPSQIDKSTLFIISYPVT